MKSSVLFILCLSFVIFLMAIVAIVAAQNSTPLSLQFLTLRSILIPVGLLLTFSLLLGMITGGSLWILGQNKPDRKSPFSSEI
jgi:hypothetical protein